jgi:hypothetical protein
MDDTDLPVLPMSIKCSDKNLIKRSTNYFEAMLRFEGKTLDNLLSEELNIELMCKLGTYLTTRAKNKNNQALKRSTAWKSLSCIVTTVLRIPKFRGAEIYNSDDQSDGPDWYKKLRGAIGRRAALNSMELGLAIVTKPYVIGSCILGGIFKPLYSDGFLASIEMM